jgi:hypothetical protein
MNRRSLAGVKGTHVHDDKVFWKFLKRRLGAVEIFAKRDAILEQRAE